MEKVYIETSVINHAYSESIAGKDIASFLKSINLSPSIGIHTIYELARTFLYPTHAKKGQELFIVVSDLDPSIIPPTHELLNMEIIKLRSGASVTPFLDTNNQAATRYEIEKLAHGIFDSNAEEFIKSREKKIREIEPVINQNYLQHISQVKSNNPGIARQVRTFEDVLSYFKDDIPQLIKRIVKVKITNFEALELSQSLNSYPALRSAIRANLYLSFICIVHNTSPSYDKPDDYRHIIDSSYSKVIITADEQLIRTTNRINQDLDVIHWNEIRSKIRKNISSNQTLAADS